MDQECSICMKNIPKHEFYKTICNHIFHKTCVKKWFQLKHTCPICRYSDFNKSLELREKEYYQRSNILHNSLQTSSTPFHYLQNIFTI
jgi:hypothetical protein